VCVDVEFVPPESATLKPWKMVKFPDHYTLWVHVSGEASDPANPRTDAYLYGAPHKIFRSPMEFVEHAIWLMKGADPAVRCFCKYCTPNQSQREINRRLNRSTDSDDEDDSGSDPAGAPARHPFFRGRLRLGAAAIAERRARERSARRAARREPVIIKAKDYRVGNSWNGGSGSGSGGSGGAGAAA